MGNKIKQSEAGEWQLINLFLESENIRQAAMSRVLELLLHTIGWQTHRLVYRRAPSSSDLRTCSLRRPALSHEVSVCPYFRSSRKKARRHSLLHTFFSKIGKLRRPYFQTCLPDSLLLSTSIL